MITIKHHGSFKKTEQFFNRVIRKNYLNILAKYGELGVQLLQQVTPKDSGKTADSWSFEIEENKKGHVVLAFTNSNENNGANIVFLLLYGHGLQDGTYLQGEDFLEPAMRPLFQSMAKNLWKEVTR